MKRAVPIAVLSFTGLAVAQQASQSQPIAPPPIRASGCVTKAVESDCLVLTDSKTGQVYNLIFAHSAPVPGIAIKFKATEHQGMTTCMKGKAVNVTEWNPLKNKKCPAGAEPQH